MDRVLSNQGIDVWDSFACWVPPQIGDRPDALVAMDWTRRSDTRQIATASAYV